MPFVDPEYEESDSSDTSSSEEEDHETSSDSDSDVEIRTMKTARSYRKPRIIVRLSGYEKRQLNQIFTKLMRYQNDNNNAHHWLSAANSLKKFTDDHPNYDTAQLDRKKALRNIEQATKAHPFKTSKSYKKAVRKQCKFIKVNRKRCKRFSLSKYCWQHKK